ncbi:MAG: hypothetical protein JSV34_00680 [Candidatus Omnitrophota bacterium]|nr:MAG: hypothetical protein JSV34_00680 [Candidatus Omnitrophota bacterium]
MESSKSVNYKFSILHKRLGDFLQDYRQNIVLLGDDAEEISYLLENYLQHDKVKGIIYVYTTASFVDRRDFFNSVVISLLSEYFQRIDSLDSLINHVSSCAELDNTATLIKNILKKEDLCFTDVLEVINSFITESGSKCAFIIEEFLTLEKLFSNLYQEFSKFIILQRNCMVVLVTSNFKDAEKILSTQLNLLFGNFEKVFLSENVFLDNYIYLKEKLFPLTPSPLTLSFFINIIGSNVIYYDSMAKIIKDNYNQEREEDSIVDILEEAFYLKEAYFFQKFIKKIDLIRNSFKDYPVVFKILSYLSQGYIRKKELIPFKICDTRELTVKLQKLCDAQVIENLGNIYKIKDYLFSFWVSYVFKPYFLPPLLDTEKRKLLWRKKIQEAIALFKEDFLKDKVKKVLELMASFKDDVLRTGRSKYRLPSIEKTKIISYPERSFHFIIGEGKEIVFVGVKESHAHDSDILDFLERGSNIRGRGVRKIFISLDRVSPTAKLIAKSHKLLLWDVNEINNLLRVYNKPGISFEAPLCQVKS